MPINLQRADEVAVKSLARLDHPRPQVVADRLRAASCYGPRRSPAKCPVATWVKDDLAKAGFVVRNISMGTSLAVLYLADEPSQLVLVPKGVGRFVDAYDSGAFSELWRQPSGSVG